MVKIYGNSRPADYYDNSIDELSPLVQATLKANYISAGGDPDYYNNYLNELNGKYQPDLVQATHKANYISAGGDPDLYVDYYKLSDDPANVTGQLLRNQYTDYINRYAESENSLMGMTTYQNPGLVDQEIQQAVGSGGYVRQALDTAEGMQQRNAARFGAVQDEPMRQAISRTNNLNRSTAIVDAANRIRQRLADRNQQIAVGTVPNAGRAYGLSSEVKGGE